MNKVFDVTEKNVALLIVYDKNRKEWAEFLHTLISAMPNIKAVKMHPAPYEQNEQLTSSENHFLFLGSFKSRKIAMKQLNNNEESAEYGIFIGQYGRVSCIDVDVNYAKIKENKERYKAYLKKTQEYWVNLKRTMSFKDVLIAFPFILGGAVGFFGLWFLLFRANRKWIERQLYACAVSEYYNKYLKSFLGINNNE